MLYQSYIFQCEHNRIIFHQNKPVCAWCYIPLVEGGQTYGDSDRIEHELKQAPQPVRHGQTRCYSCDVAFTPSTPDITPMCEKCRDAYYGG